jgi:formylglycine-generating enzyme required for sulfatase activity
MLDSDLPMMVTVLQQPPRHSPSTGPVVFLSYSRADRALADRLLADLEQAGHACWLDTTDIPGGEVWEKAIVDGITRAYAVITLVSEAANQSKWVRIEFLYSDDLGKPIIPLLSEDCKLPIRLIDRQAISIYQDYDAGLKSLLSCLPRPSSSTPTETQQRQAELAYLRRLQLGELVHTELYTPMAGVAKLNPKSPASAPLPAVVMRPEFRHLCRITAHADEPPKPPRAYDDILVAFAEVRRAALLGEPGAGKTTTLWKLARDAVEQALVDPSAPLPLLIRLGKWLEAHEPIQDFMQRELGELGAYLDTLLKTRRAVLLLDGLNEVPSGERAAKAALVKAFLNQHKDLLALVSCRELDYTGALDLGLDTVTIKPLDPPRILDFVTSYLSKTGSEQIPPTPLCKGGQGGFHETESVSGRQRGEDLFWRLAGGEAVREVWRVWEKAGADWALFWSAQNIITQELFFKTNNRQQSIWLEAVVYDLRSLMRLAGNPYVLFMLTQVYIDSGELPANRALLFDGFVQVLLLREHLAKVEDEWRTTEEGEALLTALENLAWALQSRREFKDNEDKEDEDETDTEATTVLSREEAAEWMDDQLLYRAAAASLLDVGEREVRFAHQLLQEYFTARLLRTRLEQWLGATKPVLSEVEGLALPVKASLDTPNVTAMDARNFWPRCWERTGWEESAVLLAGFYADDCTPVIGWLAEAQPEVAAQCILQSGAQIPNSTLQRLRQDWIPRLTDLARHPEPEARAAFGRALGMLTLDGEPLDNRPGVALRYDSKLRRKVPDIAWVEVPAGEFIYQNGKKISLPGFHIARYPVTHCQFQAFIDDPKGYGNPQWWQDLAERFEQPEPPRWDYSNHPRETVSWYEAVAYCRWLSQLMGAEVRLPTEQEWEKAARGLKGFAYPWGNGYESGYANIDESYGNVGPHYLQQTSAVGLYPQGQSPFGASDMTGNVWEWCLNEYKQPQRQGLVGDGRRVARGGSWGGGRVNVRTAYRNYYRPVNRNNLIGFRLVCVALILNR